MKKRGEFDKTADVIDFANNLENSALETVESGIMTGDLLKVAVPNPNNKVVYTEEFVDAIAQKLRSKIG